MSFVEESEFNGKPTLSIRRDADDKYGFTFGVRKALLMVENIDAIRAFAEKNKESLSRAQSGDDGTSRDR